MPIENSVTDQGIDVIGPYRYENLSVFLLKGKSTLLGANLLTLDEALKDKKIVVHETGNVSELAVENLSDTAIFIQSGDIVKGGKQDRVLQSDLIILPKSEKLAIASFCVERARWSARGNESSHSFSRSSNSLVSKDLKLATKYGKSQADVWREVNKVQEKLSQNVGESVNSKSSATSLQLTLENDTIRRKTKDYIKAITTKIEGVAGVTGVAIAINEEFSSADIYGSEGLFKKMWPKLLESAATEALSERKSYKGDKMLDKKALHRWFSASENTIKEEAELVNNHQYITKESRNQVSFETLKKGKNSLVVHKNILAK